MFKVLVPAPPIIGLQDVKTHLRIDEGMQEDDALIVSLLEAAHEYAESYTGRAIGRQTIEAAFTAFEPALTLPKSPANSITSVTYKDADGVVVVMPAAAYSLNDYVTPSQLEIKTIPATNGELVKIVYVAGDVPKTARAVILLIVGHLYANREALADSRLATLPMGVKALLDTIRVWSA